MMTEFLQGSTFTLIISLLVVGFFMAALIVYRPKRKPLPPSDLERVEFLRRGSNGTLWRYYLDGPDAKLWDECLRRNLHSSKGFLELNWKKETV